MERCGTCKHADSEWVEKFDTIFMRCARLPMTGHMGEDLAEVGGDDLFSMSDDKWMAKCHPGIFAFTQDASMYASSLRVSPDFGCVHHEPRSDEQEAQEAERSTAAP